MMFIWENLLTQKCEDGFSKSEICFYRICPLPYSATDIMTAFSHPGEISLQTIAATRSFSKYNVLQILKFLLLHSLKGPKTAKPKVTLCHFLGVNEPSVICIKKFQSALHVPNKNSHGPDVLHIMYEPWEGHDIRYGCMCEVSAI
jgi:hypothetical protein